MPLTHSVPLPLPHQTPGRATSQTRVQGVLDPTKKPQQLRPSRAAVPTSAHSRSPAGSARLRSGPDRSRRQPRPAPGHAQPRACPESRPRPRIERARPPQRSPSPPQPPAHQYYASADGHRFPALTATSAAAFPPLLRLRPASAASASAHLPAVGQRRHQPTSAGTRQWRPGRSVEVGAEGAHAAAAAAVS